LYFKKVMATWRLFDVIGPIMVGPSSSHTSGAVRLGLFANTLFGDIPEHATIYLHGSYGDVYRGHGTDKALIAGLLGFPPDSEQVVSAEEEAKKKGMHVEIIPTNLGNEYHPNTARFVLRSGSKILEITGESIGGAKIQIVEIDGIKVNSLDGQYNTLLTKQHDQPGVAAAVTAILAERKINIAQMSISRGAKGDRALLVINVDGDLPQLVADQIDALPQVEWVKILSQLL
jgi:L-serine dehydratase